ncbi:MAG: hypothetical protein DHS20C16_34320 [Phycisphaerae bacterium]|nr:MAG: hypothetical protein DHS20C16_34320 [Phycisphaerae bacterium]
MYKFGGLGFEFVVIVGIFAFLGDWADRRWQFAPWGLLAGCGVGLTTGIYFLVKESNKMMQSLDASSDPDDAKRNIRDSEAGDSESKDSGPSGAGGRGENGRGES